MAYIKNRADLWNSFKNIHMSYKSQPMGIYFKGYSLKIPINQMKYVFGGKNVFSNKTNKIKG